MNSDQYNSDVFNGVCMRKMFLMLMPAILTGISACDQQQTVKSEQKRQKTLNYSQETLDKVRQDVNKAMQQSKDRIDSSLDQLR